MNGRGIHDFATSVPRPRCTMSHKHLKVVHSLSAVRSEVTQVICGYFHLGSHELKLVGNALSLCYQIINKRGGGRSNLVEACNLGSPILTPW